MHTNDDGMACDMTLAMDVSQAVQISLRFCDELYRSDPATAWAQLIELIVLLRTVQCDLGKTHVAYDAATDSWEATQEECCDEARTTIGLMCERMPECRNQLRKLARDTTVMQERLYHLTVWQKQLQQQQLLQSVETVILN